MTSPKESAVERAAMMIMDEIKKLLETQPRVILGVGTGSTVAMIMKKLKDLLHANDALNPKTCSTHATHDAIERRKMSLRESIICLPTSQQSEELIKEQDLMIGTLAQFPIVDIGFDGADEVDLSGQYLIKGGGGAMLMEKVIASAAKHWIIVVEESKLSSTEGVLGHRWKKGIPIVVMPMAAQVVMDHLGRLGLKATSRTGSGKMGPIFSDQGHLIMDVGRVLKKETEVDFFDDLSSLSTQLSLIPGLVEHGLFINMATMVIVGREMTNPPTNPSCSIMFPFRRW